MSIPPTIRLASHRCTGWRFSSSAASPQVQSGRIPISSEFGGVQILPVPRARPSPTPTHVKHALTRPVNAHEFSQGTLSKRLALSRSSKNVDGAHAGSDRSRSQVRRPARPSRMEHAMPGDNTMYQKEYRERHDSKEEWHSGSYKAQSSRRSIGMVEGRLKPHEDTVQTRRRPRRRDGSAPPRQPYPQADMQQGVSKNDERKGYDELEDSIVILDQSNFADVPLPERNPPPPPPLSNLETQIYERNEIGAREQRGGDFSRYLAPEILESASKQSTSSMKFLDRARLTLGLNPSIALADKAVAVEIMKNSIDKAVATS